MESGITESVVEEATLDWFQDIGYGILHGPDIVPGELLAEWASYEDVVLLGRLRSARFA